MMYTSTRSLALRSTGQRVHRLYDDGNYVCVRIPAEHAWHNDRIQNVHKDNLREVKSAVV